MISIQGIFVNIADSMSPVTQWFNDFVWIILFLFYLIKLFKDLEINWYRLPETFMWDCTESRISYKKKKKHVRDLTQESSNSKVPARLGSAFPTARRQCITATPVQWAYLWQHWSSCTNYESLHVIVLCRYETGEGVPKCVVHFTVKHVDEWFNKRFWSFDLISRYIRAIKLLITAKDFQHSSFLPLHEIT